MQRIFLYIALALFSIGGTAQTFADINQFRQMAEQFESYAHLAKDSLEIRDVVEHQKYSYSARDLTVEVGEKGMCEATDAFLMRSLSSALDGQGIKIRNPRANYQLTNLHVYTNTELFFDHIIDVYMLSLFSLSNRKAMAFIQSLKTKDYIMFDPIMEMSHTCYMFWHGDKLIMAFVPNRYDFFKEDVSDKIVEVTRAAIDKVFP